jgi:hypothetical protein
VRGGRHEATEPRGVSVLAKQRTGIAAARSHAAPADAARSGRDGRWLVALWNQRMIAFDAASGRPHAFWPARGATSVDVWNGIAVIATRRRVVAVRLSNGHRQVIQQLRARRTFVGGA